MSLGPFDLTGGPFLQLYATLFVLTLIAGFLIPRWLRPEGGTPRALDADQLAYLAGGTARFGDTVVSRLLAAGTLTMEPGGKFRPKASVAGHKDAERSVLALSPPASWRAVSNALSQHASATARQLVSADLLIDGGTGWQMRFWQTLPYLLLLGFGAIKLDIGVMRDRPVGYLTMFLVVTAVFALIRFAILDRRTRGGIEALKDARAYSDRLRRAPTTGETDMAVALYGTAVLAGSGLGDFHTMRSASSGGGDSGSSGGDSGGAGCGGGGGGGCGGCGS